MAGDCYTPLGLARFLFALDSLNPGCSEILTTLSSPTSVSPVHYLEIFLLTCGLELPFYFVVFLLALVLSKAPLKPGLPQLLKKSVFSTVICNLVSHPAVYFLFPALASRLKLPYYQLLIGAECFAPLSEIFVMTRLWKVPLLQTATLLTLANLISWWVGILIRSYS